MIDFPIDAVYLWVDGNDPKWKKKKRDMLKKLGYTVPKESTGVERFIDNQELKYSLRSLAKFATWINKIYIITDGQIPKWINIHHPKIQIVDHKKIFLKEEYLPSFNSAAIELNIHHIKELSEHFIYLNDDLFLGRPIPPNFFFNKVGSPKLYIGKYKKRVKNKIYNGNYLRKPIYTTHVYNSYNGISKWLKKFPIFCPKHTIQICLKSKLFNIEQMLFEKFKNTWQQHFRSVDDINLPGINIGYLQLKYINSIRILRKFRTVMGILTGKLSYYYAEPGVKKKKWNYYFKNWKDFFIIKHCKPKMFCINDSDQVTNIDRNKLIEFLKKYFPEKSGFEK
jgi:hypothetical protein